MFLSLSASQGSSRTSSPTSRRASQSIRPHQPDPSRRPTRCRPVDVDSTSELRLRVGRVLHGTTAEGPGRRTAIWVQGCSIRCAGCVNPHLFAPRGGELIPPARLVEDAVVAGVEGITLLGGEPFDQPQTCAELARNARARELGVICFTGYTLEHLQIQPLAATLLAHIDLLIDGPYVASEPERSRALVGSTNQRFVHLTDRYAGYDPRSTPNRVEVRVSLSGETELAGFLGGDDVQALTRMLRSRRAHRSQLPRTQG